MTPTRSATTEVEPATRAAWRTWLARNHARDEGVWVIFRRKHARGPKHPDYEALIEEALCFGWVDSRPGSVDAERTKLYFAPRRKGSAWAASNKARVARLIAADRMAPSGLAAIAQAKRDGSWSRIDGSEGGVAPDDLLSALRRTRGAKANWDAFPPGVRRAITQWIEQARRPETRAARIRETAEKAARNERANQWTRPTRG